MNLNNPLRKLEHIGNWNRNHGFREKDRKLLTSSRAIKKIEDLWSKCPTVFDIYLVNTPQTNKTDYREVGPVDPSEFPGLAGIDFADDAVNIVFTNNMGVESVPLTGWVMAHRFAHVLRYSAPYTWNSGWVEVINLFDAFFEKIIKAFKLPDRYPYRLSKYEGMGDPYYGGYSRIHFAADKRRAYDRYKKALAEQLGTSRAARTGNLRNYYEWYYEVVAQYIITGKIRFRKLGDTVDFGPAPFGRRFTKTLNDIPMIYQLNSYGQKLASDLEDIIGGLIADSVGMVFLM